jgi:hypothetical protein
MNKAPLQRINGCLSPIASTHLVEHRAYVNPNSFLRNVKVFGNLSVASSLGNAGQDFSLPWRKFNSRHAFGQTIESDVRKVAQATINALYGVEKLFPAGIFGEISHRSAAYRSVYILATLIVREYDNARSRKLFTQLNNYIESTDTGQTKVENDHVRAQRAIHFKAKFSIGGFSNDLNLRMPRKNRVQGHTSEKMVLYKKNAYLLHILNHLLTLLSCSTKGCIALKNTLILTPATTPTQVGTSKPNGRFLVIPITQRSDISQADNQYSEISAKNSHIESKHGTLFTNAPE